MAISQALKEHWAQIDAVVFEHRAMLRDYGDHRKLRAFALEQGWDNGPDFAAFKRALVKIRVDYDQVRQETADKVKDENLQRAKQLAQMGADAAQVWLWTAAMEDPDSDEGSFAVVDIEDDPVWYGAFHEQDRVRVVGDAVSAEQSVALKAVWVAQKAFEAAGVSEGRLHLCTTCPRLDEDEIVARGARVGIAVEIHVDEVDERAVMMAQAPGFMSWKQRDLGELVSVDE